MKAARLEEGTLEIQDLPTPVPGDEEALIRISSAGVCHSDLHIVRGDWLGVPRSGVLGHEAIGVVTALGPGAERYSAVGDRVILGLGGTGGGYWCGACEWINNTCCRDDLTDEEKVLYDQAKSDGFKILKGMKYAKTHGFYDGEPSVFRARPEMDAICHKYDIYDV